MDTPTFTRELADLGYNELLNRNWRAHQFVAHPSGRCARAHARQ